MIVNRFKHSNFTCLRRVLMITALLFLYVGGSAYAECIVDGTSYNLGGTGVTTVDRGRAISLAVIRDDWDTTDDDITTCDVSHLSTVFNMFNGNSSFNQDISTWDVSNVINFRDMFAYATAFNQDIGDWNTAKATTMYGMFIGATAFNQDISDWNTAAVTDMSYMFKLATAFNQDIGDWNTAKVTKMPGMFTDTEAFNQDIGDWNTAALASMGEIFQRATAFNQDISDWNTAAVIRLSHIFDGAEAFNQDIRSWDISSNTTFINMFRNATAMHTAYTGVTGFASSPSSSFWAPTISTTTVASDNSTIAVTFSKAVYNATGGSGALETSDFTLSISGGTATLSSTTPSSISISGNVYTLGLSLSGTANGSETITVVPSSSTAIYDSADNAASTSQSNNTVSLNDKTVPTISSTTVASDNSTIAVTFSKAVYNATGGSGALETSDFTLSISGGTATLSSTTPSSISISGNVYTLGLSLSGTANGSETITVVPSSSTAIYDGSDNAASTSQSNNTVSLNSDDSTAPTMTITSSEVSDGGTSEDSTLSMTFTSSESTSDFIIADITVGNGELSSFSGSGTTYTATLTPTYQGAVTVDVAAGKFTDAAGNANTAATQFNWTYLSNPLNKQDVVGSVKAWSAISSRWAYSVFDSINHRLRWLDRHKDTEETSHQGIKLQFRDKVLDAVMNRTPRSRTSVIEDVKNIDITQAADLLKDAADGSVPIKDHISSYAQSIAVNEATRLREEAIGTLNPSFGSVVDDWSMWTSGKITIGKIDATSMASKQELDGKSITIGFDKPIGNNGLFGVALSKGKDSIDIGTSTTNVKSDNYALSAYGVLKQQNDTTLEAIFGIGHLGFDTIRKDGRDTLTGKRNANQFFASLLLRDKTIKYNNWSISPYGKVTLSHTNLNYFSESGGATALTFKEQIIDDARIYFAVDSNYLVTLENSTIKPFFQLEYGYDISSSSNVLMHYNGQTKNYTLKLDKEAESNLKMEIGVDLFTKSGWSVSAAYLREQAINAGHRDSWILDIELKF